MTKIYDLSDPAKPVFVRDFGLAGQEPGSTAPSAVAARRARADRPRQPRLLRLRHQRRRHARRSSTGRSCSAGPKEPTAANLNAPGDQPALHVAQLGRPHGVSGAGDDDRRLGVQHQGADVRDFVVLVSEAIANECREFRHATFMVDITTETRPFSGRHLPGAGVQGDFCRRGGRFGPHSSSESFAPIFYRQDGVRRLLQRRGARGRHPRSSTRRARPASTSRRRPERTAERCVTERRRDAARWRSRPTTSRPTSAASSTSPTAPTPACTSCGSPARPRKIVGGKPASPRVPCWRSITGSSSRHPSRRRSSRSGMRRPAAPRSCRMTAIPPRWTTSTGRSATAFALLTTVLRSLRHSDPLGEVVVRVHELQAYGDAGGAAPGCTWCGRDSCFLAGRP